MKTKVAVLNSNNKFLLAFFAAVLAFVFSTYANAAIKKVSNKAPVIKSKLASKKKSKPKSSVMFINKSQRQLLAQNMSAKAVDAKLEAEFISDSTPIAVPATNSLSTVVQSAERKKNVEFGAKVAVSTSAGVSNSTEETEKRSYTGAYSLSPSANFKSSNISVSGEIEYDREYSYETADGHDSDWVSPSFKLRKTVEKVGFLDSVSFGPSLSLPAGREAKRQTFQGSVGAGGSAEKSIGILSLSQGLSYGYRFYEYDIRLDGTVNSPHLFSSVTATSLQFAKWLAAGIEFTYQHAISFQNVGRSFTTTVFALEFIASENASISTGVVTLKKGTLQPDGQSNRANLYDPGTAQAFLDLILKF